MGTFVSRRALVLGASGLVGRELLPQLLRDARYSRIHVLVRRPLDGIQPTPKLTQHIVDFDKLPDPLVTVDDVYCCIGTTLKTAGSREAFRAIDFELVVKLARAARRVGAERLAVVSAMGADASSGIHYNRVKGEMERGVAELGYACTVIARPALLTGDRAATGQPKRVAEQFANGLLNPIAGFIPARWRPIAAEVVARALRAGLADTQSGLRIVESAELQRLGA